MQLVLPSLITQNGSKNTPGLSLGDSHLSLFESVVCALLSLVLTLGGVAYYVVLERKVLSVMQVRKGPNKAGIFGLLLPLADALKGLSKEWLTPGVASEGLFLVGPLVLFCISYLVWSFSPNSFLFLFYVYSVLYYICAISLNVFGVMLCGWSSGCEYGVLGGMRAGAQAISYEIAFTSAISCPALCLGSMELYELRFNSGMLNLMMAEVLLIWLISSLAELNRIPFDFVEGESELVSGYMVEYGGIGFIMIILAEYSSIIFCSCVTACLFFGGMGYNHYSEFSFILVMVMLSTGVILVRGGFPRYRYDKLMTFCWEVLLPLVGVFVMVCLSLVM